VRPESSALLTLARILRPWGRRGEVAAEILTDFPERLSSLREVWLTGRRTAPRRADINSCHIHLGQAIFHFAGIQTISDAETLRGLEVQVPLEARASLGQGRYYISDLIGCQVWEEGATAALGAVLDVQRAGEESRGALPESWILVVGAPADELLIPLAAEICTRIDMGARRIEVRLPQGLRELNAGKADAGKSV
jgi:16S rRNA processing protein RimM